MKKLVLSMHVSLDGFVGGPNGEMDWIIVNDEIFDSVGMLTDNADVALYGRTTFHMMDNYWPNAGNKPNASKHDIQHSHWYNTVSKFVVSRTLKAEDYPNIRIISENIKERIENLKQQSGKNILVFGSPKVAHVLVQHDLVDEFWLFVNPILIGKGIPLFANIQNIKHLTLKETKVFPAGVVGLHYEKNN